ncbi:MAG: acetylornithine deacetylase, partial [Sphingobium sp.]
MKSTTQIPFGEERQRWFDATVAHLDPERLQQLLFALTNIHSPTGAVREASEFMASTLRVAGMNARYLPMSERTGNVLAEKRGSGGGAAVMLYAPIDTHLEDSEDDNPWVGPPDFVDLHAKARQARGWVFGLGASNPKGMIATLTEVATALIEAEVPLVGDLLVGLADGGMPVNIAARDNAGMSNGVHHLLSRGAAPDFAVIMKPWNFVYHEEPGMGWFKLRILGTYGYAGVPRGTPGFRSSIMPVAVVIPELEEWLIDYADRNTSGQVKPHGWIAGIRSGSVERPSFPSAV